jgi:hypothetical protein
MLALSLHGHALLLRRQGDPAGRPAAAAALAEARAIAADCGMTRLLADLDGAGEASEQPVPAGLTVTREDAVWVIAYAGEHTRLPDSLGLRYLSLLVRQPGRELPAADLVRLAAAGPARPAGPAGSGPSAAARASADGLHETTAASAGDVLDPQARAAYRQRLTDLDEELAEATDWNDTERAARIRAEKDFLIRELAAATGLGGRPRQLGSGSERARLNVTRAIRTAITRIAGHAPAAAAHLTQSVRTGTRCCYDPPERPA